MYPVQLTFPPFAHGTGLNGTFDDIYAIVAQKTGITSQVEIDAWMRNNKDQLNIWLGKPPEPPAQTKTNYLGWLVGAGIVYLIVRR